MGVCQSRNTKVSNAIDSQIQRQFAQNVQRPKLLLLGASESGKSTVLKQIRLLHCQGFDVDERKARKEEEGKLMLGLLRYNKTMEPLTEEVVSAVKLLWADAGVQRCYGRRAEYQLEDCTQFFIESIERIAADDYLPSNQDMLYSRVPTTGAVQINFTVDQTQFRVFDVGGQRSQRKKWIHCFDDVNAIVYVAAISEYNQKLREDNRTNRLMEAMRLFKSICDTPFFTNSSMILFLNKTDLFRAKIEEAKVPFKTNFPDFDGDEGSYSAALAYIEQKFLALLRPTQPSMYIYETCATDSNQVQVVIAAVIKIILKKSLEASGMLQ